MLVKLLVGRSGSDGSFSPGDEIIVDDAEAIRMFQAGHAVPVRGDGLAIERAMAIEMAIESAAIVPDVVATPESADQADVIAVKEAPVQKTNDAK